MCEELQMFDMEEHTRRMHTFAYVIASKTLSLNLWAAEI